MTSKISNAVHRGFLRLVWAVVAPLVATVSVWGEPPRSEAFPPKPPRVSGGLANDLFPVEADGRAKDGVIVAAPAAPRPLRLAILPDRTSGRDWGLPYLEAAVADLNRIGPEAVFGIGDMIQGYTRSTARFDEEIATYLGILADLEADFYPVAGNHDVIPGTRDPADRRFIERYRQTFGPLRYAVEFDLATVVVLFSDEANGDGNHRFEDPTLTWLDATLARAAARGRPIVVLLHRPLWRTPSVRWSERVQPLLARHGVDAVIAGHFHAMQRDPTLDGVAYHILGTCGGMIDQHPYAGQWQHLTFLEISPKGEISIHHQPVGVTVDEEFIRAVDQDRAYRLKSDARLAELPEAVADPARGAVDGAVAIRFRNPIDVPIEISIAAVTSAPGVETVEGLPITSAVRRDAFNPFVTDVETPFRLDPPPNFTLAPGESVERSIGVQCPRTANAPPPPEIAITATFTDSRGRTVPVWIARRLAIAREIPLAEAPSPAFPIAAWAPSPYDTLEPNPTGAIGLEGDRLRIELEVPDRHRPDDRLALPPGGRRSTDPLHDAIRILLPDGPEGERELFLEPFAAGAGTLMAVGPGGSLGSVADAEVEAAGVEDGRWRIALRLPPRFRPKPGDRINVGVADNDWTYHTQWRWLAPEAFPARFAAATPAP